LFYGSLLPVIEVALDWVSALVITAIHMLVDTRVPQQWWSRIFRQTQESVMGLQVMIWGDQVIHKSVIAFWLILRPHLGIRICPGLP
jgi:hypothetical protein